MIKNFINNHVIAFGISVFVTVITIILVVFLFLTEGGSRFRKSFTSDFGGGLDRTVTVYDYNGNELATYSGKIDIEEKEGSNGKVKFDLDGKRTIIYGGIVIAQEK